MSNCITTHEVEDEVGGNLLGGVKNPYLLASDWGWQIDPIGLRYILNELYARYQISLMVVKNGLGTFDERGEDGKFHDGYRIDYLRRHIAEMREAVKDGVDLMDYTPLGLHRPGQCQHRRDGQALRLHLRQQVRRRHRRPGPVLRHRPLRGQGLPPIDGKIIQVADTFHAAGIEAAGIQIQIHVEK